MTGELIIIEKVMTLNIELKLFSILTDFLPESIRGNVLTIKIETETTIQCIIDRFKIPVPYVGIVVLNGEKINLEQIAVQTLKEGDKLSIFPPLAGG